MEAMNPLTCGAIAAVFCFIYNVIKFPESWINVVMCKGVDLALKIIPQTPRNLKVSALLVNLFGEMNFFTWVILDSLTVLVPIIGLWMLWKIMKTVAPL